jgi:PhnB protein
MAINQLNAYLNFSGSAARAIELYERVLGAKVERRMTFGEAQPDSAPATKDRIMHAVLHIGPAVVMLSDGPPSMPIPSESNTHLCLDFGDPAEMAKAFDGLASGGKVTMPLQDTFWGARFGMLTDAFNINWMFNCESPKG